MVNDLDDELMGIDLFRRAGVEARRGPDLRTLTPTFGLAGYLGGKAPAWTG